jgi:hypothetical protein
MNTKAAKERKEPQSPTKGLDKVEATKLADEVLGTGLA